MSEYMINSKGDKVHIDLVKKDDVMRDGLVNELLDEAVAFKGIMGEFRSKAEQKVEDYFEELMAKYNLDPKAKSKKGNITLENFSSTAKVQIAISDKLTFDEKLQLARMKFDEYFEQVTVGSSEEVKMLINKAFSVDKEGKVDVKRILELRSYNIKHPKWVEGVALIEESKKIVSSKSYIRFYKREASDESWKHVSLDIAAV
ncbi:conserved hypothetical protein [Sulfurovum sp. enrichment culture clone C5]|uniref:DUF3164 family protein n=1 Tax=Sulfurovum sp. enrichment culture clone C5 TaxID=497650 RepID=A0A0S4XM66_9BACT|nr:conserved hypothetical protein [Sulfurovum sp. enrichment culture clone C5]